MVRLEADDLTKIYESGGNRIVAVDSVDFTIEDGLFVTLVGPSGCGKTTLLRMMAGLETPTRGTIQYGDEDVTNTSVQERRISMVFQSIALFPFKSVRKNIEYGLKYLDVDKEERRRKAEEMAEMVGIEGLLENKPNQLSGGQQQRVALSRALVREPRVFLLDEPMSDLDAELKIDLRAELKELHNQVRTTTLYVTHDQEEAMTLSEEIIVMNDGKIQQKAPPFEVYDNPANMFVARFIGSPNMNFFSGRMNGASIETDGFETAISCPEEVRTVVERELTSDDLQIGIRPSAMKLVNDPAEGYFTAETRIYEQMGDETVIHSELNIGGEKKDVRCVGPPTTTPDEGTELSWTFDQREVHLFDGETGEAVVNGLDESAQATEVGNKSEAD